LDFSGVFDAIGDFFENPVIQFAIRAIAVYFIVLWLASAYWAFRDLQLRTHNPIAPYFAAALIVVFTPIFFPLGIVIYRIVRPGEKIGEVSERHLAEEALMAEVDSIRSCPGCRRRVHDDWIICPTCRTRLNRVCPNCGKLVGLDWSLCAWCGKDFERREAAAIAALPSAETPAAAVSGGSVRAMPARTSRQGASRSSAARTAPTPLPPPDALPER
jgi:RNA polymerase subunit RPABC4/transcription elongation factor Spt4